MTKDETNSTNVISQRCKAEPRRQEIIEHGIFVASCTLIPSHSGEHYEHEKNLVPDSGRTPKGSP
jgi:hypothetical protein